MAENIGIEMNDKIGKAMEGWLYRYKKNNVKASTFDRLLESHKVLCGHQISQIRLFELCTADIQHFVNKLAESGYSLSTIRKEFHLLSSFIRFVIGEGLPIRAAHMNVALPKQEHILQPTKQALAYEPDEQERLRQAIAKSPLVGAKAALLMMETGARVGEVLALRWSDILWQKRAMRIHATLVHPGSRKRCFVQEGAKSRSSNRTIPLSSRAMDMLSAMPRQDGGFVITASDGVSSLGYNALRNQLVELCAAANVEYRGAHVFRHTFATNAFYKGCDIKILSKLLGHASVTITYNTYIHLYGDALEEMRSIVG